MARLKLLSVLVLAGCGSDPWPGTWKGTLDSFSRCASPPDSEQRGLPTDVDLRLTRNGSSYDGELTPRGSNNQPLDTMRFIAAETPLGLYVSETGPEVGSPNATRLRVLSGSTVTLADRVIKAAPLLVGSRVAGSSCVTGIVRLEGNLLKDP